jgi:hypothetical protein
MAHHTPDQIVQIHRLLATTEFTSLERPIDKAMKLFYEFNLPRSAIIAAGVVKPNAFARAVDAVESGRDVGISGRPGRLSRQNEATLASEILKSKADGKPMDTHAIQTWVLFFIYSFFLFFYIG